ncbi:MAG: hypothetical protein H6735_10030 [Alphaproteobacteria bacterium]|nr:hypothetical protein [Alphaproteobacteria bacterium]
MEEATRATSTLPRRLAMGCGTLGLLGLIAVGGAALWWHQSGVAERERAQRRQKEHAEQVFQPAVDKLAPPPEKAYDIDETIRVIHGLDRALAEQDDLEGWLRSIARQDYRDVAPEVLAARAEILDVLQPLYAKQTELEDQKAVWEMTSEMLIATLSVVSVSGKVNMVNPAGQVEVDHEQARRLWDDLKQQQADRKQLQRDVDALDKQLFDALVNYADVYWKYVDEWDRLSVLRDRAYLAAWSGDWVAAEQSAKLAIQQAPKEREAHLLAAMAIIEQGSDDRYAEARALLDETMQEHPDQTAPALLLLGVLESRVGNGAAARLDLQQAAAYYPKQSEALTDMLDPYQMRGFLEKSREGGFITELYESTMLGAGYFSPDLQLARLHFSEGRFEEGKAKVLDHFARRRSQQQWDFVISDITFCQDLLGADFRKIFPDDAWLDLQVSRPMLGGGLQLAIDNRSDRTLHNATLVLALHLTDQFPGQYVAVPAPATVPAVVAHDQTSFGTLDAQLPDVAGAPKTIDDIVEHRAILIADEAVSWVDTDAFKLSEAEEFRKARDAARAGLRPEVAPTSPAPFTNTFDRALSGLSTSSKVEVESKYGKDGLTIELPRELAVLHPVFRLKYGDKTLVAEQNKLENDRIVLTFDGVQNFDDLALKREDLELVVSTALGDVILTWTPEGTGFRFAGVQQDR